MVGYKDGKKIYYTYPDELVEGSYYNPIEKIHYIVSGMPYDTGLVLILDPDTGYLSFDNVECGKRLYKLDDTWYRVSYEDDYEVRDRIVDEVVKRITSLGLIPDKDSKRRSIEASRDYYIGRDPDKVVYSFARQYVHSRTLYNLDTREDITVDEFIDIMRKGKDRRFMTRKYGGEYTDFVLSVDRPIFRRATGNDKKNTFDFIDIDLILRSTATKEDVSKNKQEIFEKAIKKIEGYGPFRKFGVPIAFLKMYSFVLRSGGIVTISFCLKGEEDANNNS